MKSKLYSRDILFILMASFFYFASPMLVTPLITGFSGSLWRQRRADGNHGLRPGRLYLELSPGDVHFLVRLCPDPGGHPPGGPAGWGGDERPCV